MSLKKPRNVMPTQEPQKRKTNFNEVALGYDRDLAAAEAERCLQCKKPQCVQGCPVEVPIPQFISLLKEQKYPLALAKIKEKNNLPGVCGRVCPQEKQCEARCILGQKGEPVAIGRLERFVADINPEEKTEPVSIPASKEKKVAIIGAGPAGLSCAGDLQKLGYQVTIFEALHIAGGVLMYGIPEFRLPKAVVQEEIRAIERLGVEIRTNQVAGKLFTVDELLQNGFGAVFISTGAGLPHFMNIPGENLSGVYSANEFLTRTNLMKGYLFPHYDTPIKIGSTVAVIGGGNVAMDAARTALRLGAKEVSVIYRRSMNELPARKEEVEHAQEEGVKFKLLLSPVEITSGTDGCVQAIRCQRYQLGEPDTSGRCVPVPVVGEQETYPVQTVIMAIGQGPNPLVPRTTQDLELTNRGNIVADAEDGQTSKTAVFAGGDIVTGAATVIMAMGAGKKAAKAIDAYLSEH